MSDSTIEDAVKEASNRWKAAFNNGDAAGCAAQYEDNAMMHARPFGTFTGRLDIQAFWQKLINDGYSNIEYINTRITTIDSNSAKLKSGWRMNKASGLIHKELWVLQDDGTAKLREDDFEVK